MRSRNWSEKTSEKMSAPITPRPMRQRPKMTRATATQPRPAMMSSVKLPSSASVMNAHRWPSALRRASAPGNACGPRRRRRRPPPRGSRPPRGPRGRNSNAEEPPGGGHDDQEGEPGQSALVEDRAEPAQFAERVDRRHRLDLLEPPPAKISRFVNSDRPMSAMVSPDAGDMLAGAEGHRHERHDRPGREADGDRRRPSSGDPVAQAVTKPANAPAYIVPPIPRLRMPPRSAHVSPTAPYTRGVALRSGPRADRLKTVIQVPPAQRPPVAEGCLAGLGVRDRPDYDAARAARRW